MDAIPARRFSLANASSDSMKLWRFLGIGRRGLRPVVLLGELYRYRLQEFFNVCISDALVEHGTKISFIKAWAGKVFDSVQFTVDFNSFVIVCVVPFFNYLEFDAGSCIHLLLRGWLVWV
jgi:hypothetical protein